jgi:hypothetical protein
VGGPSGTGVSVHHGLSGVVAPNGGFVQTTTATAGLTMQQQSSAYNDKPILTLVNSNKLKTVNYKV